MFFYKCCISIESETVPTALGIALGTCLGLLWFGCSDAPGHGTQSHTQAHSLCDLVIDPHVHEMHGNHSDAPAHGAWAHAHVHDICGCIAWLAQCWLGFVVGLGLLAMPGVVELASHANASGPRAKLFGNLAMTKPNSRWKRI